MDSLNLIYMITNLYPRGVQAHLRIEPRTIAFTS